MYRMMHMMHGERCSRFRSPPPASPRPFIPPASPRPFIPSAAPLSSVAPASPRPFIPPASPRPFIPSADPLSSVAPASPRPFIPPAPSSPRLILSPLSLRLHLVPSSLRLRQAPSSPWSSLLCRSGSTAFSRIHVSGSFIPSAAPLSSVAPASPRPFIPPAPAPSGSFIPSADPLSSVAPAPPHSPGFTSPAPSSPRLLLSPLSLRLHLVHSSLRLRQAPSSPWSSLLCRSGSTAFSRIHVSGSFIPSADPLSSVAPASPRPFIPPAPSSPRLILSPLSLRLHLVPSSLRLLHPLGWSSLLCRSGSTAFSRIHASASVASHYSFCSHLNLNGNSTSCSLR